MISYLFLKENILARKPQQSKTSRCLEHDVSGAHNNKEVCYIIHPIYSCGAAGVA